MEEEHLDDYDKELEAELQHMPTSDKKILNRFMSKLKSVPQSGRRTANQAALAAKAGLIMARMARLSQDAQKIYWDMDSNKQKQNPDFDKALKMVDRSISLCNEVMATWPSEMLALMPMKEKLIAQRKDIELQKSGQIVDPSTLISQQKGETSV